MSFRNFSLTVVLSTVFSPFSWSQDESETGMLPVDCQKLWEVMPGNLNTWELKRSTAETRLGGWIESRAVREYEKIREEVPEPVPGVPEVPVPPPEWTRLIVTDTGKFRGAIAHFENFSTEKPVVAEGEEEDSGSTEKVMIESWPAMLARYGEDEISVEILVANRFLVQIQMRNQPEEFLEEWVSQVDLVTLTKTSDTQMIPLPESIMMTSLDQLNPDRNDAHMMATTSNSRLDQEVKEDEETIRRIIEGLPPIQDGGNPEVPEPGAGAPAPAVSGSESP